MMGLVIKFMRDLLPDCQPADRQHADNYQNRKNLYNTAIHHEDSHVF
ncbi:MAG: hypothetical protein NNA30_04330 [Nitrospira sp.]|nr:hypothetical protein [Nitrospira sp.]